MMYLGRNYRQEKVTFTVAEAVVSSLSDTCAEGELERIYDRLDSVLRAVGHVVQYLADHAPAGSAPLREMLGAIVSYRFDLEDE